MTPIDAATPAHRPAHRPSRRAAVVETAMNLFSRSPIDKVTVLDIAGAVGMTPAAVYYHFASKEQILLEGLQNFSTDLITEAHKHVPVAGGSDGVNVVLDHTLALVRRNLNAARVYFVNSVGNNTLVERLRYNTRTELVKIFQQALHTTDRQLRPAEAGVKAVGLVSLLETAAASHLSQDTVFRGLGSRRFAAEIQDLAARITGSVG